MVSKQKLAHRRIASAHYAINRDKAISECNKLA